MIVETKKITEKQTENKKGSKTVAELDRDKLNKKFSKKKKEEKLN